MARAYIDLHRVQEQPALSNVNAVASAPPADLKSNAIFNMIKEEFKTNPDVAKQVKAVFLYNITKNGETVATWTVDFKKAEVYAAEPKGIKPDTTFTVSDDDFFDLAAGKLNPQMAFMKGKLKIKGNIMLAEKMKVIMQQHKAKL